MTSLDRFAKIAATAAMTAAADYIRAHNLKVVDYDAATECIRGWVKMQLPAALDDAKEAMDAGMSQIAETTFLASMRLAGIEAAKEFGFPADYVA